jgi:hypothetical protein
MTYFSNSIYQAPLQPSLVPYAENIMPLAAALGTMVIKICAYIASIPNRISEYLKEISIAKVDRRNAFADRHIVVYENMNTGILDPDSSRGFYTTFSFSRDPSSLPRADSRLPRSTTEEQLPRTVSIDGERIDQETFIKAYHAMESEQSATQDRPEVLQPIQDQPIQGQPVQGQPVQEYGVSLDGDYTQRIENSMENGSYQITATSTDEGDRRY